ncbi:MAG TPA: putative quinol monooxygenase [Beijerinckiaceae bacterium]|nr:putative quinol monooxygenase [Beijerinckiaceae bacterium]
MVIVIARITCQPGKRAALLDAARAAIVETRKEPGCISYSAYADSMDENLAIFYEEYASEAACMEHMGRPYTQALIAAAPQFVAAAPSIIMHGVSGSRTLA